MTTNHRPICPRCGAPMHKAGHSWSGQNRIQVYRCPKCGKTSCKQPQ
ncbi:MAG: zf-TFIIB domain-containing protein [Sphaerochaeta sp.]|nr:zf-TFIIB domain-containing protein [Sphaerochaeta sp.]